MHPSTLRLIGLLCVGIRQWGIAVDAAAATAAEGASGIEELFNIEDHFIFSAKGRRNKVGGEEDRKEEAMDSLYIYENTAQKLRDGSSRVRDGGLTPPFPAGKSPKTPVSDGTDDDPLSFSSWNEYAPVQGSPWPHIAEPHRATTLLADSTVGDAANDVFLWTFADGIVLEGREVKRTFTTLGKHEVTLSQEIVATGEDYAVDRTIMVKYVRREIRQLTRKDREEFFDAMETLYRLPTSEGYAEYGEDYKGINFFVQMHLDGAGVKDCDHWHDDAGIMTHHVGYTLLFEQALQVVNPAVSVPYWEYTIESASGLEEYGDSEVFDRDWFGTASPDNPFHTVDEGRWAYLAIQPQAWDTVHNPYGLLRSPWNVDPTPYVTRHDKTNGMASTSMVTCMAYQMCFNSETLADMNNCLNGGTHGPVHIMLGGEWGDPEEDFINKVGYSQMPPLITKYLWRKGYLRTPDSCYADVNGGAGKSTTCRASCPAEIYKSRGMSEYDVLLDVKALHWIANFSGGVISYRDSIDRFVIAGHERDPEFENAFWIKMLKSLCDPGYVGDLYTSAAPYDPLFWVIHPTAERFLSWRRKLGREQADNGYAFDERWGYKHSNVVGESGTVCDWTGVGDDETDLPTCVKGICGGHNKLDVLPFEVKINGKIVKMTNIEWLDFIYPDNDDLPYMYNEFKWDHCVDEGYTMGT